MDKLEAAENKPEEDGNNLPRVTSLAQKTKEDLHDILEMTKAGNEHSNETQGEGSSPQTPNTDVGLDSVFDEE